MQRSDVRIGEDRGAAGRWDPMHRDAARIAAHRARLGSITYVAGAAFLAFATPFAEELPQLVWGFLLVMVAIAVARTVLLLRFDALFERDPDATWRLFVVALLALAATWSIPSGIAIVRYGESWSGLLAILISAVLSFGGITAYAPCIRVARSYLAVMSVPLLVSTSYLLTEGVYALLPMVLVWLAYTLFQSRELHREFWQSLRNARLLELRAAELQTATEIAESASQAKGEFLANISHEVRTPLSGMIGLTEVLLDDSLSPDERRTHLATIHRSGHALLNLLNDVLVMSRIESGKLTLVEEAVDLRAIVGDVEHLMTPNAQRKNLDFSVAIADNVPDAVTSSAPRLRQVLTNLAGNAIKFTERGFVKIHVDCRTRGGATWAHFVVSDSGVGIPAGAEETIFQPFRQADNSPQRRHGGAGLGLAICHSLVEMLGGEMGYTSEPDVGSTFWFKVPVGTAVRIAEPAAAQAQPPQVTAETAPAAAPHATGPRILCVDDNLDNQLIIVHQLRKLGCEVEAVDSGEDAIEALKRHAFDLVIMDCQMPGMDGYETTRRIRDCGLSYADMPIVAATAHHIDGERDKCIAAGMSDFLTKPISAAMFADMLDRWVPADRRKQTAQGDTEDAA